MDLSSVPRDRRPRRSIPGAHLAQALHLTLLLCYASTLHAQQDSVFLDNGDVLAGTIRGLDKAVLTVTTSYSQADLRIKWSNVTGLHTVNEVLVVRDNGIRLIGRPRRDEEGRSRMVVVLDTIPLTLPSVVRIVVFEKDAWSRLKVAMDLGYNYTQASDLQQLSLRSNVSYQAEYWRSHINLNSVNSFQRDADDIRRTDLNAGHRRLLPNRWLLGANAVLLANTAQLLRLRSSYQLSAGNAFIYSNRLQATAWTGIAYTAEVYNSEDPRRRAPEGIIGLELNLFNMGNLSLLLSAMAFPNLDGSQRWRMDHRADARYDLPRGIYIRAGGTLNYDSDPVPGAVETDYVVQTALGWSF